jgi:hypothetical protein
MVQATNQYYSYQMEITNMVGRIALGVIVMMFVLVPAANAGGKESIQNYFSDTAAKVKATPDPAEKRAILHKSLQTMTKALDKVESIGLISQDDRAGVDRFKTSLQEKLDELTGDNGYERVSDVQLNAFSQYVVQDMEQADKTITIGIVTALLIVIIIILLV